MNTLNMKKIQQGFTLIELMIVVAIIGILAAVAIPAYQDYLARAQAAEGASLLGGLKSGVAEWYGTHGDLPTMTELNAVTSGKYISGIALSGNTYTATFKSTAGSVNAKLAGKSIGMTFNTSGATSFTWVCTSLDSVAAIKPSVCP